MAVTVWLTVSAVEPSNTHRTGWIVTLLVGSGVGLATYLLSQAAMRSPELSRLRSAVRGHRSPLADVGDAT